MLSHCSVAWFTVDLGRLLIVTGSVLLILRPTPYHDSNILEYTDDSATKHNGYREYKDEGSELASLPNRSQELPHS